VTWTPERQREYQREYQKAWRARNPEKVREIQRKSNAKNSDRIKEQRRAWRERNADKLREQTRARCARPDYQHRGWTEEARAAMWAAQDGKCYLCGEEMTVKNVRIDHDHGCCPANQSCRHCRRGMAHHRCNIMIGMADDDPARLRSMADALEAAQMAFAQRKPARASLPLSRLA
jgi:hypothetical protein